MSLIEPLRTEVVLKSDYDTLDRSMRESWKSEQRLAARIRELEQKIAALERVVARHVKWREKALRYLCKVRDRASGYRPLIENFIADSTTKIVESTPSEVGK